MRRRAGDVTIEHGLRGPVGQRLRRLSEWALAGCVSAAFGCGAEPGHGVLGQPLSAAAGPVLRVPCSEILLAVEPVKPAQPLDYIGVYITNRKRANELTLLGDHGEACARANDRDACLAIAAELLRSNAGCPDDASVCPQLIVTTQGDEVLRHDAPDALAHVLGEVDTASEAVLFAQLHGLYAACSAMSQSDPMLGTLVQPTSTGWRVQSHGDRCAPYEVKQSIELRRDGTSDGFDYDVLVGQGCATATGRRPAGLQPQMAGGVRRPLAAFLAEIAQLEAASVPAFQRLARELRNLGAPQLSAAAERSARDEVRHTRLMGDFARRYGAQPLAPRVATARRARSPFEIALENAVEGCVRETFGALVAWHQSASAQDPTFAHAMRGIAIDETKHAQLSWEVAAWLEPRLSAREQLLLLRARAAELEQLSRDITVQGLPATAAEQIGLPSSAQQHALLNQLSCELAVS